MNTPGERFIVSIKRDVHEVHFDGSKIDTEESVSLIGLERVISLKAQRRELDTPKARIDNATAILASAGVDQSEEHHLLSGESELSRMVDDFMVTYQTLGTNVSFDIPDSSIGYIPGIASKFGVVSPDELPGQYL